jgi:hypothetical protein
MNKHHKNLHEISKEDIDSIAGGCQAVQFLNCIVTRKCSQFVMPVHQVPIIPTIFDKINERRAILSSAGAKLNYLQNKNPALITTHKN